MDNLEHNIFRYPSKPKIPKNNQRLITFDQRMTPMAITGFQTHNREDNHNYFGVDVKVIRRMTPADISLKPINLIFFSMALIV